MEVMDILMDMDTLMAVVVVVEVMDMDTLMDTLMDILTKMDIVAVEVMDILMDMDTLMKVAVVVAITNKGTFKILGSGNLSASFFILRYKLTYLILIIYIIKGKRKPLALQYIFYIFTSLNHNKSYMYQFCTNIINTFYRIS